MDVLDKKKKARQQKKRKEKLEPHRPANIPWHRWIAASAAERSTLVYYANKPKTYVPKFNRNNDPPHIVVAKHAYYRDPNGEFIYDMFVASDPRWKPAVDYIRQLASSENTQQTQSGSATDPIMLD